MKRQKVDQLKKSLHESDVYTLSRAVEYCGGYRGERFKGLLLSTLQSGYDKERIGRLEKVVKNLTEEEIIWLCEQD